MRPVAALPDRLARKWRAATRHQFILGVRDGSVTAAAFDVWLAQDYRFVVGLREFQGRLADRLPAAAESSST
jgi:thiaminase